MSALFRSSRIQGIELFRCCRRGFILYVGITRRRSCVLSFFRIARCRAFLRCLFIVRLIGQRLGIIGVGRLGYFTPAQRLFILSDARHFMGFDGACRLAAAIHAGRYLAGGGAGSVVV
jgi:hypothetical protein